MYWLKRNYTTAERKKMAANGEALPDGSYPIHDKADLQNAVSAYGHHATPRVKEHIIQRARALGATATLPDKWGVTKSAETSEQKILVAFGGTLKALGNGKIGGYLVRFTTEADPDLEGDFFTKDTDFGIHTHLPLYYHHGQDETLKTRRIGEGEVKADDAGLWFEAQMQLRDSYERHIYNMAEKGKLGYSSGAVAHLVEKERSGKANFIKSWPLGEASATPTPAEPRNTVLTLKALKDMGGMSGMESVVGYDPMDGMGEQMAGAAFMRLLDSMTSCLMMCCYNDSATLADKEQCIRDCFAQASDHAVSALQGLMPEMAADAGKALELFLDRSRWAANIKNERDFEKFLRDAGFPRDAAVPLTLHGWKGWKALCQRDAEDAHTASTQEQAAFLHLLETELLTGVI